MTANFRFDFPPEMVHEREETFKVMRDLLALNTLNAVQEACRLQLDWLQRYPDDYVMIDAGEVLGKSYDALLAKIDNNVSLLHTDADERLQIAK